MARPIGTPSIEADMWESDKLFIITMLIVALVWAVIFGTLLGVCCLAETGSPVPPRIRAAAILTLAAVLWVLVVLVTLAVFIALHGREPPR